MLKVSFFLSYLLFWLLGLSGVVCLSFAAALGNSIFSGMGAGSLLIAISLVIFGVSILGIINVVVAKRGGKIAANIISILLIINLLWIFLVCLALFDFSSERIWFALPFLVLVMTFVILGTFYLLPESKKFFR